jgi:hypothetical protein
MNTTGLHEASKTTINIPEDALSVDTIKVEIKRRLLATETSKKSHTIRNPYRKASDAKDQARSYSAPAQVVAFLSYLLSLVPSKAEASERATLTNEKLAFYKGFPSRDDVVHYSKRRRDKGTL